VGGRREAEELAPVAATRRSLHTPQMGNVMSAYREPFGGALGTGRGVIGLAGCMFSESPSPPVTERFVSNVSHLRVTADLSPPVIERPGRASLPMHRLHQCDHTAKCSRIA
jgi:hypothetical protein